MKKTIQTLATAAMFAAAAVSSFSVSAQESEFMEKSAQPMAPLYGPPPVDRMLGDMNQDDELDVRDLTVLKRILLQAEGDFDLETVGDEDGDGWIQIWSWGSSQVTSEIYAGDLNQDAKVNKADVQEMIRRLTGAPKEEEEPIVTTMTVETEVEMTSQTAYGPPPAWHSI